MEPTPAGQTPLTDGGARPSRGLPPKLLEDAAERVGWVALFTAVIIVVVQLVQWQLQPSLAALLSTPVNRLVSLLAVLSALAVFAAKRYRIVPDRIVLVLGGVMEVVVSGCIASIETSLPTREPVVGVSAIGPYIVALGVFIPMRPVWTFVTSMAAATTFPMAMVINSHVLGFDPVPLGTAMVWPFFNYLFALFAFLVGRRLYGMSLAEMTAMELGSYRLVARIGAGGMGEVWRASHRMLARSAAIKLVRPQAAGTTARQQDVSSRRFKREANVIASLQSPHTVYLYDFGVSEDGRFYYVMELLDGISLQELVTAFGPQPAPRVLSILRQTCASLGEAHERGLVHRDLKPSNVMLCKVGLTYDFVKVLDFGLAKVAADETVSQLTVEGTTTGTPGYMAPEVALGEATVDGRADVYALGCVAYFLLTGTLVFEDTNPMSMALKHVQATPAPPSTRTELPIPADLERLVLECLNKKPEDRPASARDLRRRLEACAVGAWTEASAEAWWERHLPPTSSIRVGVQPVTATPPVVRKV
jgi:tRNA A-37 threonylcarbamoyl transferase component Bud32